MDLPATRLASWIRYHGWTRDEAAEKLDISRDMLDSILRGRRLPGRLFANAIERQSAPWELGPIRSEEWDEVERRSGKGRRRTSGDAAAEAAETTTEASAEPVSNDADADDAEDARASAA